MVYIPFCDPQAATMKKMKENEERIHSTSKPCAAIMANGLPSLHSLSVSLSFCCAMLHAEKKALSSCFPLITRSVHDSSPFSCNPVAWNTIENNMSREHGYAKPFTNNGGNCLTYFHENLHAYLD